MYSVHIHVYTLPSWFDHLSSYMYTLTHTIAHIHSSLSHSLPPSLSLTTHLNVSSVSQYEVVSASVVTSVAVSNSEALYSDAVAPPGTCGL